jgi:hypothetical protein
MNKTEKAQEEMYKNIKAKDMKDKIYYRIMQFAYEFIAIKDTSIQGLLKQVGRASEGLAEEIVELTGDSSPVLTGQPPVNIEEQIEEIKKEFESKFGDELGVHIPSKEIWDFFLPHLSHDEIKREAVRGFLEYANDVATKTTAGVFLSRIMEQYLSQQREKQDDSR